MAGEEAGRGRRVNDELFHCGFLSFCLQALTQVEEEG